MEHRIENRRRSRQPAGRRHRWSGGFTLVEALVSLTLLSVAVSLLLLATDSTLQTAEDQYERAAAEGIARQMMNEIVNRRYQELGADPLSSWLGPSADESAADGRSQYDDTDDYTNYRARPPEDLWGQPLGQGDDLGGLRPDSFRAPDDLFDDWVVLVRVQYLDPTDLTTVLADGSSSNYRRIKVVVRKRMPGGKAVKLLSISRIVSYSGIEKW